MIERRREIDSLYTWSNDVFSAEPIHTDDSNHAQLESSHEPRSSAIRSLSVENFEGLYAPPKELPENWDLGMAIEILWDNSKWVKTNENEVKRAIKEVNCLKEDTDVSTVLLELSHIARALARKMAVCEGADRPFRAEHSIVLIRYVVNRFEFMMADFRAHYYQISGDMSNCANNADDVNVTLTSWAKEWRQGATELISQLRKAGTQLRSP